MTRSDFTFVVELDAILFRDLFVLYHQTTKKKVFLFFCCLFVLPYLQISSSGVTLEGGGAEGAAMRAAGGQQ